MATVVGQRGEIRVSEYVLSRDLAREINAWLERGQGELTLQDLARAAGISSRAINKVLTGERRYQTIFLADRLMTAMGSHIIELRSVWLEPRCNSRITTGRARCRPRR